MELLLILFLSAQHNRSFLTTIFEVLQHIQLGGIEKAHALIGVQRTLTQHRGRRISKMKVGGVLLLGLRECLCIKCVSVHVQLMINPRNTLKIVYRFSCSWNVVVVRPYFYNFLRKKVRETKKKKLSSGVL